MLARPPPDKQSRGRHRALGQFRYGRAGLGVENDGTNWLIPTDARLADWRDLRAEAIDLNAVLDNLSGAKMRVILLDACRDNPFKDKWTSATRSFQVGLSPMSRESSLIIYAADQGARVSDTGNGGNSYFAEALSKRLTEPGLALQMLGLKVADDVRSASQGTQRWFITKPIALVAPILGVPDGYRTPRPTAASSRTSKARSSSMSGRPTSSRVTPASAYCPIRSAASPGLRSA